ncbi:hypothetical protein A8C56_10245 [Niabella ginsenosidivorans]|uniref:CCDC81-like prokaryotic HU domain-containing protein n=1 Tax=Niabella ginsenosidivorans TaxID=1176587 RepID=A0A1A9I3P4_9BACT|nr:hypothetical protein [Niabella ginsenosidivorans]ANH81311.1 hypothetical protein A8C56_10245 [Niabella ginsenosidivorans]
MFSLLATYLYQHKKLTLPGIGHFELVPKNAAASYDSIEAPGWTIHFTENKTAASDENPDSLYHFLSTEETLSKEEAREQFEEFARNVLVKLSDNETVHWEDVGILEKPDERIAFTPANQAASVFTGITAQKISRDHTEVNHPVLMGDKETSSGEIRAHYLPETGSGKNNKTVWIVLAVAVIAATVFFLKNGCTLQSAGNHQKAGIQKSSETYKLK